MDILLHVVSLSRVTSLCASFRMYGFEYSRSKPSVNVYFGVSAGNVNTPATGGQNAGRQILKNGANVLLLDGRHRQEAM